MSDLSDFFENKIGDHMLRNQAYTPPATIYVALFTAATGLEANNPTGEVTGGSYARQAVTLSAFAGGASSNSGEIAFPVATAPDWGSVTHAALVDHATNTNWGVNVNVLMWDALVQAKTVNAGDTFKFPVGDLDVSFS
jgi:hypothetical protein